MSSRLVRNSVVLVVMAVFGLALLWTYIVDNSSAPPYTYSQLMVDAAAGKVDSVTQDGTKLSVVVGGNTQNPKTAVVSSELIDVRADLCAAVGAANPAECVASVKYGAVEESAAGGILTLLITAFLPVLLIGGFIFFMMRQAQGTNNQAMSFGKSRARMF
ncbi:MAG: hypothetical protein ABI622_08775, partial [Chloroflexota bacterium]